MEKFSRRRGRPAKFTEKSLQVTVTLPLTILEKMSLFDPDKSKAIAKCVTICSEQWQNRTTVEIITISKDSGLIVVGPSNSLRKISWLRLVEIAPDRFLLSVPSGTAIESLEIAIGDLIEELSDEDMSEKSMLQALHSTIRIRRRKNEVTKGEILFIDIGSE